MGVHIIDMYVMTQIRELARALRRNVPEILKFALVGASGFALNLLVFNAFIYVRGSALLAPIPAFFAAVTSNYVLNSLLTFDKQRRITMSAHKYVAYIIGYLLTLLLNFSIYYVLYIHMQFSPIVAQAASVLAASILNFFSARYIILWRAASNTGG